MSHYTIEAFLYDLAYKPGVLNQFKSAPDEVLAAYPLTALERADIQNWNVRSIHAGGVSPMLLMLCYIEVHGMENRTKYLRLMGMTGSDLAPASH